MTITYEGTNACWIKRAKAINDKQEKEALHREQLKSWIRNTSKWKIVWVTKRDTHQV